MDKATFMAVRCTLKCFIESHRLIEQCVFVEGVYGYPTGLYRPRLLGMYLICGPMIYVGYRRIDWVGVSVTRNKV